ncbi:MAG TPA: glutaredoxin 3 [Xanthobacteraceae bacterium]
MPRVELYTTPTCSYCHAAKALLRRKGISFAEINVVGDPARRAEMVERAHGRMTVPQIFIGPTHVGGFEELYALEQAGRLDALLTA